MNKSSDQNHAQASDWHDDDMRWSRWMAEAQRGDKRSYEQLLSEIATTIENYLWKRFGPADFIEDITQECLLRIHNGRHSYDAKRPFRAWMFAIVRHCSIDYLRSRKVDKKPDQSRINPDSQHHPTMGELAAVVDASLILSKLSREQCDIILLTKYFGYNADEVGAQLGISVSAVRVRLHRAMNCARRLLNAEDYLST